MSAHLAAYASVALSIGVVLVCMIAVPVIYSTVSSVQSELQVAADEFRMLYDDAQKSFDSASAFTPQYRQTRQAGYRCSKFVPS